MSSNHTSKKPNMMVIGIASIVAIFLIVAMTVSFTNKVNGDYSKSSDTSDSTGKVSQVAVANSENSFDNSVNFCKIIVGRTTIYDDSTLAVTLNAGESTYYSGYSIKIESVNSEGCVVSVNGESEYLATGQLQRIGSVYVTVKDAVHN